MLPLKTLGAYQIHIPFSVNNLQVPPMISDGEYAKNYGNYDLVKLNGDTN